MGPTLSKLQLNAIAPDLLILPNVGLSPVAPQVDDGDTIEPHVSVPIAKGTNPATVADADPADEPDEPCVRFHGFLVLPPYQKSPMANAPSVNLAINTAPASLKRVYTYASVSIVWVLYGAAPHVVVVPFTANKSFKP
jgi:hypothetical protein